MTTNIYILRLEGGHYYVGKTNNLERRKQEHINGTASTWTKKYKPVGVEKIIPNASSFDEDKYTKEYMSKYGIDKVRGGSYSQMTLDDSQKEAIARECRGATDACQKCGKKGHFIKFCPVKEVEDWDCQYCDRTFTTAFGCGVHQKSCKEKTKQNIVVKPSKKSGACYRCGRQGHYSPDCYASTHAKGYSLDSDEDSDEDSD